jgi:hypothetical protein
MPEKRDCLCGKPMTLLFTVKDTKAPSRNTWRLWACPPMGCGRIFLQGSGLEVGGTFYLPEQNDRKDLL